MDEKKKVYTGEPERDDESQEYENVYRPEFRERKAEEESPSIIGQLLAGILNMLFGIKLNPNKSRKNSENKDKKKKVSSLKIGISFTVFILIIAAVVLLLNSLYLVNEGEFAYLTQFGAIVNITEDSGLHFKLPFIQNVSTFTKRMMIYDVSPSEVLTADKKAMIVDSYALWKINDVKTFYRTIGTVAEVEHRIDTAVFSVIKNIMGNLEQNEVISDENSSRDTLNDRITEAVKNNLDGYGVDVMRVEIRRYDLPPENLSAVFDRMISERHQMAASYKAEGGYSAAKIRNETDKESGIILGEANAEAERIKGNAEEEYMSILADLYGDKEKAEFYSFCISLEAIKNSFKGDKTLVLGKDSLLAQIVSGSVLSKDYFEAILPDVKETSDSGKLGENDGVGSDSADKAKEGDADVGDSGDKAEKNDGAGGGTDDSKEEKHD